MSKTYVSGKGVHNAYCDICGFQFKSNEMRKRWDGYMVCADDFELRHPQELLRAKRDQFPVAWTRSKDGMESGGLFDSSYPNPTLLATALVRDDASVTYGNRFTTTENVYVKGARIFLGRPDAARQEKHYDCTILLYNGDGTQVLKSTTARVRAGDWYYVPFTPNYLTGGIGVTQFTIAAHVALGVPAVYIPSRTYPAGDSRLTYLSSRFTVGASPTYPASADDSPNTYLIDVVI